MTLPEYDLEKHFNVSDAQECQEKFCQEHKKCTSFVYDMVTNLCTLKKPPIKFLGIVQLIARKNHVFGPKYCPGMCNSSRESLGKVFSLI